MFIFHFTGCPIPPPKSSLLYSHPLSYIINTSVVFYFILIHQNEVEPLYRGFGMTLNFSPTSTKVCGFTYSMMSYSRGLNEALHGSSRS